MPELKPVLPDNGAWAASSWQLEVAIRKLDLRLTQVIHALAEHDAEHPGLRTGILDALEHGRIT